jgi:hypothetical protein
MKKHRNLHSRYENHCTSIFFGGKSSLLNQSVKPCWHWSLAPPTQLLRGTLHSKGQRAQIPGDPKDPIDFGMAQRNPQLFLWLNGNKLFIF